MVKSISDHAKVRMPSFFGYMLWSGAILLPLFAAITFIFFI
jgi:Na+/H+ antiporter NhaD/arsenite permease-like protein